MNWQKSVTYNIEDHPFESFVPPNTEYLIIGTFPTHKKNLRFNLFYSGKDNTFWNIIEKVFNHSFKHNEGEKAVEERKTFLKSKGIGITDMIEKCYRKYDYSTDESLFPIILNDIFSILDENSSIKRIILTSRTEVFGALGLLKTYFLQNGLELKQPEKRKDKILEGSFRFKGREIKVLVPYSPSLRVFGSNNITPEEVINMYRVSLI